MSQGPPLVAAIRRFALDDGPGIRATVFFKGCPLRCVWCHNPECYSPAAEMSFDERQCVGCRACETACGRGAIGFGRSDRIDRGLCVPCPDCAAACPSTALIVVGTAYEAGELTDLLLRDRVFFEASGGGVTLSGGEPLMHVEYAGEVLRVLKREGVHTAIQTCGLFDYAAAERAALPYADLVYYDLKLFDEGEHRRYTGVDNGQILENFRRLSEAARDKLRPRVPLVAGITATRANLEAITAFLKECGFSECELLAYNPGCLAKRRLAGLPAGAELAERGLSAEEFEALRRLVGERLAA